MCYKFIKSGFKGCPKGDSCKYAHPKICRLSLLSISVTELSVISIMLQAQLGPTLIKTYPEILCQKTSFWSDSLDAYQITPLVTTSLPCNWHPEISPVIY